MRAENDGPTQSDLGAGSTPAGLVIGEMVAHYRIESRLGAGGMGVVYRAMDVRLRRTVALKVVTPQFAGRSQREARAVAALNHPNICTLHDVGPDFLVMEYVEGTTLADRIARGPIPIPQTLAIARQISLALEAAHEKGVVHRDLKPANIKVGVDNKVKVLDFGLAKMEPPPEQGGADNSPTLTASSTQPGTILGTPAYMSPEQAVGKPVDRRTDVWAFGAVLWEMLTGRRLFEGETANQTLAEVLRAPVDFSKLPSGTPPEIRRLLRRCLDRDSENRLRDIAEARVAIDAPAEPDAPEARHVRRLKPWIWIPAAALIAALLAGFAVSWFRPAAPGRLRLKAQISTPAGETTALDMSPDGKFLTLAQCEAFVCRISVRPLDTLDYTPIGDGYPHGWSPDSRFFLSLASGKLYKNSPLGGPQIYLADVPSYFGDAAWLDTGTIVIATDSGLYSLPESGGALTKISTQPASTASWLPGARFLYSNDRGVFASSMRGDKPVQVLPENVSVTYVPPAATGLRGHLVFTHAGTLLAQEFDLDKLQLVGDPVHIVPSGSDPGGVYVNSVVASRNGVLAYRTGDYNRLALTWFDRSGKKLQTVSQPFRRGEDGTNCLSPDDSRAIVVAAGPDSRSDLWIADLERGTFTRFTFNGGGGGIWSPDGKRIIWDDLDHHVYIKAADGSGNSELLFRNPNCPGCLMYDWSQDGKLISFATFEADKAQILLAAVDGDRKPYPFRQGNINDFYAMFSPDRRWLAYTSDESGQNQIYIESIPSGRRRVQVSTEGGNWPVWRRDGTELFYRQEKDVMAVPVHVTAAEVQIGNPQKLFSAPVVTRFMVSRDGQRFLIPLPVESVPSSAPITIDTDWRAGLARPK